MKKARRVIRHEIAANEKQGRSAESRNQLSPYNALVARAELVAVNLVRSNAELHPERIGDAKNLVVRVRPPQFVGEYNEKGDLLSCGVRMTLELGREDSDADPVLQVFAEYHVVYRLPEGTACDNDLAQAFSGKNGVFNAWPFFRELSHSLVARMGIPAIVLPLFRMPLTPQNGDY
jgi:hypothetical protein